MNIYGHIIKFERLKQNMKQVTLAEGICQPSYLSRIENNSIVPSGEIIEMIVNKLKLNISTFDMPESEFISNVQSEYKEAILFKDREKTSLLLKELNQKPVNFSDVTLFYDFQLMVLRLNLISHGIQFPTKNILFALSELRGHFNYQQQFTFYINVGFIKYIEDDLESSLENFQKAIKIMPNIKCKAWEIADMEYALGLVYLDLHRYVSAIEFTKHSIIFFDKNFYNTRSIEAYIVLSIAYKNSQNYEQALSVLKLAQNKALIMNHKNHLSLLHYNIGAIATLQGNSTSAITNYLSCIALSSKDLNTATSMVALIIEFAKKRDYTSVIEWCQKGISLCKNSSDPTLKFREPHFLCYQAIYGDGDNFERTLQKCINTFEHHKEFRYSHKYSLKLAEYYLENKKYKKAAIQYKKANEYLALKENRKFTEDL